MLQVLHLVNLTLTRWGLSKCYFLGSGSVGDDDLWYHHIPGRLRSFCLFPPFPFPGLPPGSEALPAGFGVLSAGSEALPASSEALPAGFKADPSGS